MTAKTKATSSKILSPDSQTIQPLRSSSCSTLSHRSNLTYELALDLTHAMHFRIKANDGGGFFSPEWIAWKDIQAAITKVVPVTSLCLRPLFKGKSVNTSGFLMAVLIAEGILEPLPKKTRHFKVTGVEPDSAKPSPDKSSKPAKAPAKKPLKKP